MTAVFIGCEGKKRARRRMWVSTTAAAAALFDRVYRAVLVKYLEFSYKGLLLLLVVVLLLLSG